MSIQFKRLETDNRVLAEVRNELMLHCTKLVDARAATVHNLYCAVQHETKRAKPAQLERLTKMKTPEEFMSFGQANIDAMVKSSQILATGVQDLTKQFATAAQASMDEVMANMRALSSVKSVKEAIEMQTTLARTAIEKSLAHTGQVADQSLKLAEQAIAPISGRLAIASEGFTKQG